MDHQRVNIHYSVGMEQLPKEMRVFLEKVKLKIDHSSKEMEQILNSYMEGEVMTMKCMENLERIRVQLTDTDYLLNDVTNIISGFLNYKLQEKQSPEETAIDPKPNMRGPLISAEELEEKISEFKETL